MRWKPRALDLALLVVMAALAARAVAAVLPKPLRAERRRVEAAFFVADAPSGLAEALRPGERIWCGRNGAALGRIKEIRARPSAGQRRGWSAAQDLLILVESTGRYRAGQGLYLHRQMPVRVGESYPLRTTLGSFWGRLERLRLADPP